MKKGIIGLILALSLILMTLPAPAIAAGGPWLELTRANDTPGSRSIVVGTADVVALKFTLTAHYEDIRVDSLMAYFWIYQGEGKEAVPAQSSDVTNIRIDVEPDFQLTTTKNFDGPNSNSVTFNGTDWLDGAPIISETTPKTLSIVFDVPATCQAPALFVTTGEMGDVNATIVSSSENAYVNGRAQGTIMVIYESGFINYSILPDAPQKTIIAVGETGIEDVAFTKIDIFAGREGVAIQSLGVANMTNSIRDSDIKTVSLWDENTQLGTKQALIQSNATLFSFPPDSPWIIPANTHKILTIKADLNGMAKDSVSGSTVALALNPSVKAVGLVSGKTLPGAPNWIFGNTMVLRKSKPYVASTSLPSLVLSVGEKAIYRWTVTADEKGPIGWKHILFDIDGDVPSNLEIWNLNDMTKVSLAEEHIIPAGETETYELRGLVTSISDGVISTKIPQLSDSVVTSNLSSIDGSLVWSDGIAWTNDYLVPGIPTATLSLTNGSTPTPAPSITVTSPNGGEIWKMGETKRITWNSKNIDFVYISLTDYGHVGIGSGGSMSVVGPIPASTGYYDWKIPYEGGLPRNDDGSRTSADKYKINISEVFAKPEPFGGISLTYGVRDSSDDYFNIVALESAPKAGVSISPAVKEVRVGELFSMDIQVTLENGQKARGAQVVIDYDPTALQVVDKNGNPTNTIEKGNISALNMILCNSVENGTISYAAGRITGDCPDKTFLLARIWLKALKETPTTSLAFVVTEDYWRTMLTWKDDLTLSSVINGELKILESSDPDNQSLIQHLQALIQSLQQQLEQLMQWRKGDLNNDGEINGLDITYLEKLIAGLK